MELRRKNHGDVYRDLLKCVCARIHSSGLKCTGVTGGFSLFELLVVLAIVCIFSVMAIPDMKRAFSGRDLILQAEELSSRLNRIRDLAMENGYPWRVIFNPGRKSWSGFCDKDNDCQRDPGEATLGPFILGKGIVFGSDAAAGPNNSPLPEDGVSFQDDCITYSPVGASNSGSIYLKSRAASIAIRVYPASGAMRIWVYRKTWENIK